MPLGSRNNCWLQVTRDGLVGLRESSWSSGLQRGRPGAGCPCACVSPPAARLVLFRVLRAVRVGLAAPLAACLSPVSPTPIHGLCTATPHGWTLRGGLCVGPSGDPVGSVALCGGQEACRRVLSLSVEGHPGRRALVVLRWTRALPAHGLASDPEARRAASRAEKGKAAPALVPGGARGTGGPRTWLRAAGWISSAMVTLPCCSRRFTSFEQQMLTELSTCQLLYSTKERLSMTSGPPGPPRSRLASLLASIAFRGSRSPAMARQWAAGRGDPGSGQGQLQWPGRGLGFGVPRHGARPAGRGRWSVVPLAPGPRTGWRGDWPKGSSRSGADTCPWGGLSLPLAPSWRLGFLSPLLSCWGL